MSFFEFKIKEEKIIEATKYISNIKKDLKMCNAVEKEIVRITEQLKEFYKREAEREKNEKRQMNINKVIKHKSITFKF